MASLISITCADAEALDLFSHRDSAPGANTMRDGSWSNVNGRISGCLERAERHQLVLGRGSGGVEIIGEVQRPTGGVAHLLAGHAGVQRSHGELTRVGVGFEDTEVGDHPAHATAAEPEPLAIAGTVAEPHRRPEVAAFDECPLATVA